MPSGDGSRDHSHFITKRPVIAPGNQEALIHEDNDQKANHQGRQNGQNQRTPIARAGCFFGVIACHYYSSEIRKSFRNYLPKPANGSKLSRLWPHETWHAPRAAPKLTALPACSSAFGDRSSARAS